MQFISRHKDQTGGSLAECLTPDRGDVGSSLTSASAMCPLARHIYPSLVLIQSRKTHSYIKYFIRVSLLLTHQNSAFKETLFILGEI